MNDSDEERTLPDVTDPGLYLLYEDQQVEPTFRYGAFQEIEHEPYEGDDVQPGARREGWILFEVGAGLSEADIDFLWQDDMWVVEDGEVNVLWTAG